MATLNAKRHLTSRVATLDCDVHVEINLGSFPNSHRLRIVPCFLPENVVRPDKFFKKRIKRLLSQINV